MLEKKTALIVLFYFTANLYFLHHSESLIIVVAVGRVLSLKTAVTIYGPTLSCTFQILNGASSSKFAVSISVRANSIPSTFSLYASFLLRSTFH